MSFADNTVSEGLTKVSGNSTFEENEAEWDTPETYFYYNGNIKMDWSQYNWRERNNPCHPSYYMDSDRAASCNVFASNIGIH